MGGPDLSPLAVGGTIPDGGGTLTLGLPSNVTLTGVSAWSEAITPRTRIRFTVRRVIHGGSRSISLGNGISRAPSTTKFAFSWHGNLPLDKDYQYELITNIFNLTGAEKRWSVVAYIAPGKE